MAEEELCLRQAGERLDDLVWGGLMQSSKARNLVGLDFIILRLVWERLNAPLGQGDFPPAAFWFESG